MAGAGPRGQSLTRSSCPDKGALAGLGHAIVASIEDTKPHLVWGVGG
jgi:hypothetical protein